MTTNITDSDEFTGCDLDELETLITETEERLAQLRAALEEQKWRIDTDPAAVVRELQRRLKAAAASAATPPTASDDEVLEVLKNNAGTMRRCDLAKQLNGKVVSLDSLRKQNRVAFDGKRGGGAMVSLVA